jgi:hypothetical protein
MIIIFAKRIKVIAYYKAGQIKFGSKLHQDVRSRFFAILQMCEAFTKGSIPNPS